MNIIHGGAQVPLFAVFCCQANKSSDSSSGSIKSFPRACVLLKLFIELVSSSRSCSASPGRVSAQPLLFTSSSSPSWSPSWSPAPSQSPSPPTASYNHQLPSSSPSPSPVLPHLHQTLLTKFTKNANITKSYIMPMFIISTSTVFLLLPLRCRDKINMHLLISMQAFLNTTNPLSPSYNLSTRDKHE